MVTANPRGSQIRIAIHELTPGLGHVKAHVRSGLSDLRRVDRVQSELLALQTSQIPESRLDSCFWTSQNPGVQFGLLALHAPKRTGFHKP